MKSPNFPYTMTFVLGAPRSGTTMLEHMLAAHSQAKGGPEPHLLTPLAHLGYWHRVDKAPYDHIVSALGQRAFVDKLPGREDDYWAACRAYCETLYSAYMSTDGGGKVLCIDKTPEYATIWPFLFKVFPNAKYIVLTRHPGAIFTSFANSFFDGDFDAAQRNDAVLERYIPALAGILRQCDVEYFHLSYEELVSTPERSMRGICDYLGLAYEPGMVSYGRKDNQRETVAGLGDPIGVKKHVKPSGASVNRWADELASDQKKLSLFKESIERISTDDLARIGYPVDTLLQALNAADRNWVSQCHNTGSISHRWQRRLIIKGRKLAQYSEKVRAVLCWLRMACDVVLREC